MISFGLDSIARNSQSSMINMVGSNQGPPHLADNCQVPLLEYFPISFKFVILRLITRKSFLIRFYKASG